nr:uncharacterized protein CI109_006181 [Kwoniella shandongensis]KAA5525490.1 hypothetical protein CI109_006181 [Kwoniella shandongensis]
MFPTDPLYRRWRRSDSDEETLVNDSSARRGPSPGTDEVCFVLPRQLSTFDHLFDDSQRKVEWHNETGHERFFDSVWSEVSDDAVEGTVDWSAPDHETAEAHNVPIHLRRLRSVNYCDFPNTVKHPLREVGALAGVEKLSFQLTPVQRSTTNWLDSGRPQFSERRTIPLHRAAGSGRYELEPIETSSLFEFKFLKDETTFTSDFDTQDKESKRSALQGIFEEEEIKIQGTTRLEAFIDPRDL